jgi:hypothetical protein
MNPLIRTLKTSLQLGLKSSLLYAIYRFGFLSGHYRRVTPTGFYITIPDMTAGTVHWPIHRLDTERYKTAVLNNGKDLRVEANEIVNDQLRFFGKSAEIFLFKDKKNVNLTHWTESETRDSKSNGFDIKLHWEPARFNWVFPLARAYSLFHDETYVQHFWQLFNDFTATNPFNSGLNWSSAQEVALRMIALIFSGSVFKDSKATDPQNMSLLLASIYLHAKRIPPTLAYARAQNNNHLIIEAVGLYCAGSFFDPLPIARQWKNLGWKYFNQAIQQQISANGEYTQHSLNYHRLMLQASLWMDFLVRQNLEVLPAQTLEKLKLSTQWLLNYLEPLNGKVPNLGHNDGSDIFPLTQCDYSDYRPVAQTAAVAFLGKPVLPSGCWDEELLWLNLSMPAEKPKRFELPHFNEVPWVGDSKFRVYFQAIQYHSRPAHADQLHADIWYKGHNLAMDAGTFSYNAAPPWENALAQTAVHNTITIDGLNQMLPAGRFLWLEWANARVTEINLKSSMLQGEHDGYWHLGISHKRKIWIEKSSKLFVVDHLEKSNSSTIKHSACLHWLLPDWRWKLEDSVLSISAPFGKVVISIANDSQAKPTIDLIREGKSLLLKKSGRPNLGWYSPTYAYKEPALSFTYSIQFTNFIQITSEWEIIDD